MSDVDKALVFYRDQLGLTFLFSPSPNLAFLNAGNLRIMLSTPQGAGNVGENSVVYFSVSDIEKTFTEIIARGAISERPPALTAKMPDHDLWMGFIRDPDNNLIGIMEEVRE